MSTKATLSCVTTVCCRVAARPAKACIAAMPAASLDRRWASSCQEAWAQRSKTTHLGKCSSRCIKDEREGGIDGDRIVRTRREGSDSKRAREIVYV